MIVILFLSVFDFVSRFNDPDDKMSKSETAGNIVGTTSERAQYNLLINVSISF